MLKIEDKIFCPSCGEELPKEGFIAFLDDRIFYDCAFCRSEVTVELDNEEYKITVNKGW